MEDKRDKEVEPEAELSKRLKNIKADRGIKFPVTVSNIKFEALYNDASKPDCLFGGKCGDLVKVRPCAEEFQNKTYLGILIGELPLNMYVSWNAETNVLEVSASSNPAIFVPSIKRLIWGCGSWWQRIKDESDLSDITDKDINDTWYVKALHELDAMQKEKEGRPD